MLARAKEQMEKSAKAISSLDEKIMAKVDEKIDRVAAGLRKQPEEKSMKSPATPKGGSMSAKEAAGGPKPAASPAPTGASASDAAAAAQAFATVPKEEIVGLLHKTNSRCKQLEMRYAELKRLHETLLEEKRQLVATRGRASASIDSEREQIEATLKQGYEERLQELEEHVASSGAIKKQLQQELERASAQLRDEASERQHALRKAEEASAAALKLRGELVEATSTAEKATLEAASARAAAATEQAALLERVMQLQGEVAASQHSGGGGGGGGGDGASDGTADGMRALAAEAARKAEREAALDAQQRLRNQLAAGEAALAEAHGKLSAAERAAAESKTRSESEAASIREELASKEKALSRALSNYKEEVGRWGEKIQALENDKVAAAAEAARQLEKLGAEWQAKLSAAVKETERTAQKARYELEAEISIQRSTAATETSSAEARAAAAEKEAAAKVAAAVREREEAVAEAKGAEESYRQGASARLRGAEETAARAKASEAALLREREVLAKQNLELQRELQQQSQRTSEQVSKWAHHSASASEHEAVVQRLRMQVDEMESSYRTAKGVKATLEAEVQAARRELAAAQEECVQLKAGAAAAAAEAEGALAAKEKETASWKAKWKAQSASAAEVTEKLDAAERRVLAEAAAHAAVLATREQLISELQAQLETGRPQEQQMLSFAREQAKRDEEVGRLRGQLKSLREMLKESHSVLKHLMRQEQTLKDALAEAQRTNERSDALNVDYLKNVLVAFLIKVYGDADDEEHIKLARVLQTILCFSPEDTARVNEKIGYYEASWWHRTANLLKSDASISVGSSWMARLTG